FAAGDAVDVAVVAVLASASLRDRGCERFALLFREAFLAFHRAVTPGGGRSGTPRRRWLAAGVRDVRARSIAVELRGELRDDRQMIADAGAEARRVTRLRAHVEHHGVLGQRGVGCRAEGEQVVVQTRADRAAGI